MNNSLNVSDDCECDSNFGALKKLYLNAAFADVHFIFKDDGDVKRVPANKSLLAVTSPVFERMFFGTMKETGDVEIVDADADVFEEFLKFFYFRNVELTMEFMKSVFHLVEKYNIWQRAFNASFNGPVIKSILPNDIPSIANYSVYLYQMFAYFKQFAILREDIFIEKSNELLSAVDFKRLDQEALKCMLELNFKCREVDVFHAILDWAKHSCELANASVNNENVRNHLGDCLKSIRFNRMTIEEFTSLTLLYSGLFTPEEFQDIVLMLTIKDYQPTIFYQQAPRWDQTNALQCKREFSSSGEEYPLRQTEVVLFTSSQTVWLGSIHIERVFEALEVIDMSVVITEIDDWNDSKKEILNQIHRCFESFVYIVFLQPVLIQTHKQYEIRVRFLVEQFETRATCSKYIWKPTIRMSNGLEIEFHPDSTLEYDISTTGYISQLDFNECEKST